MKDINSYIKLILKFSFAILAILLTQFLFWLFNSKMFFICDYRESFLIFIGNLRYATTTCIVYLLPFIVLCLIPINRLQNNKIYNKFCNGFFYLGLIIMLALNCTDIAYYSFTFSRTNSDVLSYFGVNNNWGELIPAFLRDYWYILLIFLSLIFASIFIIKIIDRIKIKYRLSNILYYSILIITIALLIIGIRGGLQLRPIGNMNANLYTINSKNNDLVLNTPFCFYRNFSKNKLPEIRYFDEDILNEIYTPIHKLSGKTLADSIRNKPELGKTNLVIIILESFNAEYTGIYDKDKISYTPFLDSLADESWVFKGMANAKRSIEGVPAIIASIPNLMDEPFITSPYNFNDFTSIVNILEDEGYSSSFFHGGNNGTMGFDLFTKQAGFDNYYGRNEYPYKKDYDGTWGIFDEPYFQYYADQLNSFKSPFISYFFSLSSHHPYTIPSKYIDKFPKGEIAILETIGYSDYALKLFFDKISEMPFFDNTLFVISSDHTAQAINQYYYGNIGMYEIPIIFYKKGLTDLYHKDYRKTIIQQIDISPSILDLLSYDKEFFSFGNSVFDSTYNQFHLSCLNEKFQLIKDNYLLNFSNSESFGLYSLATDSLCNNNLINEEKGIADEMTNFIKAYIQQYNNRMLTNKLNETR